ncbi:hypothetical protein OPKNFCMD_5043 [Methylobacterium crusticola]|uniref:CheW-like domain-containing protein n=1 Tax=Methylobacterium crusticola TaxID=1697972 RepID=A0ABQ4R561_9HYPH|nr:chemotaxis protein CheW [Methylobacterium crusticola]GJD52280.1 hypothetical protein OPKNFCMD_5043 [Methylobacterium crusticola]
MTAPAGPVRPDAEAALSPARIEAIVAARTVALARRGAAAAALPTRRLLLCRSGPEHLGLPLEAVAEVFAFRPCTPVPGAPPALVGLTGRGGVLVSVLDLARALGLPSGEAEAGGPGDGAAHVVLLRREAPRIGLKVDRVLAVVDAVVEAAGPATGAAPAGGLGTAPVAGYAREAADHARRDAGPPVGPSPPGGGAPGGFAVLDLPGLLHPFLPGPRPPPGAA